jgi:hypothetical protein
MSTTTTKRPLDNEGGATSDGKRQKTEFECAVCYEQATRACKCTQCHNYFCHKCIINWFDDWETEDGLAITGSCPTCRRRNTLDGAAARRAVELAMGDETVFEKDIKNGRKVIARKMYDVDSDEMVVNVSTRVSDDRRSSEGFMAAIRVLEYYHQLYTERQNNETS